MREDADLDYTVAELVDGALFNSGQSCCAIEVRLPAFIYPLSPSHSPSISLTQPTENIRPRIDLRRLCAEVRRAYQGPSPLSSFLLLLPLFFLFPSLSVRIMSQDACPVRPEPTYARKWSLLQKSKKKKVKVAWME